MKTIIALGLIVLLTAGTAVAQEQSVTGAAPEAIERTDYGFVEASGAYGFQFGEQPYLPTTGGEYKHPLTNGFAVGVSAGWEFVKDLALVGNWEWTSANSRNGDSPAMESIEGTIEYHTIALGLRWSREIGPGHLSGELGAGVILPFETMIHQEFASSMSTALGVDAGHQIDEYNLGVGAYGTLGYQWDILPRLYVSTALKLKSFQSGNDGKETRYENFVVGANAQGPIVYGEANNVTYDSAGPVPPHTYSVQDLRLQIAVGFRL